MLLPMLAGQQRRLLLAAAASMRPDPCVRRCLTGFLGGRCGPQQAASLPSLSQSPRPLPLCWQWRQRQHQQQQPIRWGHGPRKMVIRPSRHQWEHFWDDVHYFALLGFIPCGLLALYLYIFVGPAELTEIPEGYEPEEYEYHRHPLTRAITWLKSNYILSDQEAYEREGAYLNEEFLRVATRREFKQIMQQEGMLGDYRGYYFVPVNPRPVSQHHSHRQIEDMAGDLPYGFQSEDPRELPTELGAPRQQY